MSTTLVRVDRGDGLLFNIAPGKDMEAFKAANPGAKEVAKPAGASDDVAMPEAPAKAESAAKDKGK